MIQFHVLESSSNTTKFLQSEIIKTIVKEFK